MLRAFSWMVSPCCLFWHCRPSIAEYMTWSTSCSEWWFLVFQFGDDVKDVYAKKLLMKSQRNAIVEKNCRADTNMASLELRYILPTGWKYIYGKQLCERCFSDHKNLHYGSLCLYYIQKLKEWWKSDLNLRKLDPLKMSPAPSSPIAPYHIGRSRHLRWRARSFGAPYWGLMWLRLQSSPIPSYSQSRSFGEERCLLRGASAALWVAETLPWLLPRHWLHIRVNLCLFLEKDPHIVWWLMILNCL